ncbi:MAG: 16S rRNA (cytosine(1402)-N(4))-methyltransferase RsmH [Kiritimatiellae bacterium]|nr:16S rRNA (cytosine(1402)-N(4))-methyltransferase RsmH [Kiritimatiellia bacterium]MBR4476361.1 16S rRNA (cytosine(1402)-N(4))-methyltransferase RsmH [Kiritimatiellia bacterium]
MTNTAKHVPVLLKETVDALRVRRGGRYVDGTLGRAGHTRAILELGGEVLGIDRDAQAISEVEAMGLKGLTVVNGNHGDIEQIARAKGWSDVDGVLLDLGVSSPQLDEADRGFSFLREGPLDMRMDCSRGVSAADIVNGESAEGLERIFREWGEEPQAHRIARAIVKAREEGARFTTTTGFAEFVERLVGRHGGHHPATRVFQALRMEVNDEMGELRRALSGALALLKSGGRFAVITFESLTDREVKRFFAAHAGREVSLQQGGSEWCGELPRVRLVARRAVTAAEDEVSTNPRSRSAKLRIAEKE